VSIYANVADAMANAAEFTRDSIKSAPVPGDTRAELAERARASVAGPTPCLRIPGTDPRARIPARFAPVYMLQA
jgi:hypothetical protein